MRAVPVETGRPVPQALAAAVDAAALRAELEQSVAGEVRFDAVSRALYSTDASVYQIVPLGVVVPRTREDIVRTVRICAHHRCPITMRGGGTSQAGQAIGAGLQIDTSKYCNAILELNVDERWAIVEPGIVLDELNAALKPHGLRFAPDISTASRATIGGMMANNSSGARSVLYGKTIDHVIEQHVVLADGSLRPLPASRSRGVRGGLRCRDARGRRLPGGATPRHELSRERSNAATRRSCGASAATTSTRLPTRRRRST